MLDLKGYTGFALRRNDNSKEAQAIMIVCALQKIPYIRVAKGQKVPDDYVPCGSIEFCEGGIGMQRCPRLLP